MAKKVGTVEAGKDDGPNEEGTQTYTAPADMSSATDITSAPATATNRLALVQAVVSVAAAMSVTLQSETPGNERVRITFSGAGTFNFVPRYPPHSAAGKKWQALGSTTDNVSVSATVIEEA